MSRVSAKRTAVVIVAGLVLVGGLAIVALRPGDAFLPRMIGIEAFQWAVPLTAGVFVGLSAWALLGDSAPTASGPSPAETECPSCGRMILRDWRLCPHCGAFVSTDVDDSAYKAEGR